MRSGSFRVARRNELRPLFSRRRCERRVEGLETAQFVRESDEGFKLLTVQEKSWDTTRSGLSPRPADRNRIKRELFGEIFSDPKLRTYRYHNRPFKVALFVDGEVVES